MERVYVDTSVFGGCFEPLVQSDSRRIIDLGVTGDLRFVFSAMLVQELEPAPGHVRELWESIPSEAYDAEPITAAAKFLADRYIRDGVLASSCLGDAIHIAIATVAAVDAVISWNFKHLVNPVRIEGFNRINLQEGFGRVIVRSPKEFLHERGRT